MRFNAYTLFLLIILLIRPVFGYDELTVELNSPVTQLVRGEPLYVVINANNQSEQRVKIRYEVFASDNGIDFVHIEANDMIDKHSTFIRPNSSRNIAFLHLWAYYSHQFKNSDNPAIHFTSREIPKFPWADKNPGVTSNPEVDDMLLFPWPGKYFIKVSYKIFHDTSAPAVFSGETEPLEFQVTEGSDADKAAYADLTKEMVTFGGFLGRKSTNVPRETWLMLGNISKAWLPFLEKHQKSALYDYFLVYTDLYQYDSSFNAECPTPRMEELPVLEQVTERNSILKFFAVAKQSSIVYSPMKHNPYAENLLDRTKTLRDNQLFPSGSSGLQAVAYRAIRQAEFYMKLPNRPKKVED